MSEPPKPPVDSRWPSGLTNQTVPGPGGARFRVDVPDDPTLAQRAGVSVEAVQLLRSCDVVDLHVESSIPLRLWGYDLTARHNLGWLGGRFFGHLDFPRALEAGLTGTVWSISTNVLRGERGRLIALQHNVKDLCAAFAATAGAMRPVRNHAEYLAVRKEGAHAAMLAVQGGNAYDVIDGSLAPATDDWITRVTLLHLTNSVYGSTSSPAHRMRSPFRKSKLTARGQSLIERLNAERIFVDLAHIDEQGFWNALDVHDRRQPAIVTHTGVDGVTKHWRNLTDAQIRAVADTGGVVGIMFQTAFLKRKGGPRDGRMAVEHLQHLIDIGGEDVAAIGSDYDGAVVPPPDLREGSLGYVRLVQHMLDAGFSTDLIQKILGANYLRTFKTLRPGTKE